MKKVLTSLALTVSALTLSMSAHAGVLRAVIDFETPVNPADQMFPPYLLEGEGFLQPGVDGHLMTVVPFSNSALSQPGDLVGAIGSGSDCGGPSCPTNNSSTYLSVLNDAVVAFESIDGFRFSVKRFSASFLGNADGTPFTVPGAIRLQGVLNNVSTTYTAFFDGSNFQTFTTTGAFANTEFDYVLAYGFACTAASGSGCTAFSTNRAQFALDDITIEHVPEPASLALLGAAGLAALGARRRRSV